MNDRSYGVAFNEMINNFYPPTLLARTATAAFDGFPTAMLGFAVVVGSIIVALCVYWLIVWCAVGSRAWDSSQIPKKYSLRDEIIRDKYGGDIFHASQLEPNLVDIRRPRWTGVAHASATVLCGLIIIFGVYSGFQAGGYDPAILVGLGVIGLGLSWGLQTIVMEAVDGIRVNSQSLLLEGDNIISWATGHVGKVSYMGATRFKMHEINEIGDFLVHYMGYRQLLAGGFSRYETGGEKKVYRYKSGKNLPLKVKPRASTSIILNMEDPKSNSNRKKTK